jgi:hypothetical protein
MKHTPGPWKVVQENDYSPARNEDFLFAYTAARPDPTQLHIKDEAGTHELIAICHIRETANARLIAAAPALLDALRQIAALLNQPVFHTETDTPQAAAILRGDAAAARAAAREAIIRAEGNK